MANYALLMMVNDGNEVLLLKRTNARVGNNQYCLVGGKIEDNETARQAIIREAKEEVGIDISADDLTLLHTLHQKGHDIEFLALVFSVSHWQGVPVNNEPHKHAHLQWFSLDALPENLLPGHRQALESIKQGIGYSEYGW